MKFLVYYCRKWFKYWCDLFEVCDSCGECLVVLMGNEVVYK